MWDDYIIQCGHRVDHSESYIDDNDFIRVKYICTEDCQTPWIKLMKVPHPDEISIEPDESQSRRYKWNDLKMEMIILFEGVEYEIAFKSVIKMGIMHTDYVMKNINILHLRPISNGERVIVIVEENGKITPMQKTGDLNIGLGKCNPETSKGYESWRDCQRRSY